MPNVIAQGIKWINTHNRNEMRIFKMLLSLYVPIGVVQGRDASCSEYHYP